MAAKELEDIFNDHQSYITGKIKRKYGPAKTKRFQLFQETSTKDVLS